MWKRTIYIEFFISIIGFFRKALSIWDTLVHDSRGCAGEEWTRSKALVSIER